MPLKNPMDMHSTVGLTFVVFASGGLANPLVDESSALRRERYDRDAGGCDHMCGRHPGYSVGHWLGERAKGVIAQPYLGVSELHLIVTTLCAWAVMVAPNIYLIGGLVFVAQIPMWRSAETTDDTRPCHARGDVLIARDRACFLLAVTPVRSLP
jgi:hypothetical protein